MSNYSALKTDINNNIYENNTQQITGTVLNTVLKDMVAVLGAGYQFAGCAYLDLNPGAPDAKVFYLAGEGLYPNFDNIQVPAGKLGILKWDTRWRLETIEGLGGGGANLTGYISLPSVSDLPEEGQPTIGYLIGENLYLYVGEGGDTADGKYQNCGGFRGPEGVGITDIEQVVESVENGGRNTVRITLSDGHSYDVYIRNGKASQGLFTDAATLNAQRPNPSVGEYAFVGSGFPADIYVCNTAGTWTDSGADYDGDSVDLTDYATKAEVNQLEAEVTYLNTALDIDAGNTPISPSGTVTSIGIDSYGEIITLSATSYIIAYVEVTEKTKIRVQHNINGPSSGVGIYGYVDSVSDIEAGTTIQGKGGVRTTSGSYDETIDVPAGKVFVLSSQTSKCSYSLSTINASSGTIDAINQRLSSLEETTEELEEAIVIPEIEQRVESFDSTVDGKYIDSSDKVVSAGSSAYVIYYRRVFSKTKFRIVQTISGASYALGKIGYVNSVSDIVDNFAPTMLKSTSAQTGSFDTVVEVPAGKVLVVSGCTTASKYSATIYALVETTPIDSLPKYPKRGVNLIQSDAILDGMRVDSTSGLFTSGTGYSAFEVYFPKDGMRLYMSGLFAGYFIIFDKNGNVLDSGSGTSADRKFYSGYVIPKGAYRGRFSSQLTKAQLSANGYLSYYHGLVEGEIANRVTFEQSYTLGEPEIAPTDYVGRDVSTFRKICCIGDSLTAGTMNIPGGTYKSFPEYSYPAFLSKISGTEVVNLGDSGESSYSWWELYQNDERLYDIDCAIIQLGVNDSIDTWDSLSVQAFTNIVNKLKTNNPGIIIFLAGIINGQSYRCEISGDGYYQKDQNIRALYESTWASDNQVFFIDWAKWGHLRDLQTDLYNSEKDNYNNGHLSAFGYNRLAQDYYNYIGWIMHNDDQKFGGIQFIESPE